MSQSLWTTDISIEDVRRKAADWYASGGREELLRALERGEQTDREFQKAAKCDPEELGKPMTV